MPNHPLNFFSLRRRSCKCFVAASSCFLWKPGVPACIDAILGGCIALCFMLMGTSPSALCAPLPSLGVSGAVAMFSPWGGLWPLVLGTLCLEPCLICCCQTLGSPSPLASQGSGSVGRMVGGRPFLLGWIVHNVHSETQHHIFIIVIKLYCTKMLGHIFGKKTGMPVDTVGETGERGNG